MTSPRMRYSFVSNHMTRIIYLSKSFQKKSPTVSSAVTQYKGFDEPCQELFLLFFSVSVFFSFPSSPVLTGLRLFRYRQATIIVHDRRVKTFMNIYAKYLHTGYGFWTIRNRPPCNELGDARRVAPACVRRGSQSFSIVNCRRHPIAPVRPSGRHLGNMTVVSNHTKALFKEEPAHHRATVAAYLPKKMDSGGSRRASAGRVITGRRKHLLKIGQFASQ